MEGMRATRLCHPRRGGWKKYLDDAQRERMEKGEEFRVVPHDKYDNPLKRHVVDPRDLAAAFLCAIKDEKSVGELFNISGPAPFNYQKLADYLNSKESLPTYKISTPDAFSFEINVRKAKRIGFTPRYSIFDTVDWALNGNPL
jgi:nucleoside-diphosphate-sugar epimerase